jgi:peptide deformylase
MIKKILTVPNPILREKSKSVDRIDKKTNDLIRDLKDTLKASDNPKGVGLSAPQIGISKRVLIIEIEKKDMVIINPEIEFASKETLGKKLKKDKKFLEGCLSVPNLWGFVDRPYLIKAKFQDETEAWQKMEFEGKEASLFQHEYDHLDGILFVDRILQQKGKIYQVEKNDKDEEELVEVKLI